MINQKLLVSDAKHFSDDQKINPYYQNGELNRQKAITEHNEILNCFKQAGINVIQIKSPSTSQDGVYTANWALVHQGKAILAKLPTARQNEEQYAKAILEEQGIEVILPPKNQLFSGQGDSLICGKYLFAGSGYRSTEEAQQFAADTFGLKLIQLHTKPQLNPDGTIHINPYTNHADSFFYDLDLALSVINENTIAYCPEAFDEESIAKIEHLTDINKIVVDFKECTEGFACNLVSTGNTIIMSNKAPKLKAELESLGLSCLTPDVSELKRGGGYIRCISLWLS